MLGLRTIRLMRSVVEMPSVLGISMYLPISIGALYITWRSSGDVPFPWTTMLRRG